MRFIVSIYSRKIKILLNIVSGKWQEIEYLVATYIISGYGNILLLLTHTIIASLTKPQTQCHAKENNLRIYILWRGGANFVALSVANIGMGIGYTNIQGYST